MGDHKDIGGANPGKRTKAQERWEAIKKNMQKKQGDSLEPLMKDLLSTPLTGTEKQIAWANDIRRQAAESIAKKMKDDVEYQQGRIATWENTVKTGVMRSGRKATPTAIERAKDNIVRQRQLIKETKAEAAENMRGLKGVTKAKAWIDNRSSLESGRYSLFIKLGK